MTLNGSIRPDVSKVLAKLKDFQRDTVEYVFRRLYTDADPVSRFLIADEVGLGKTLVARGVIAKAVDALWDTVPRIDVVYICSNQEIAQQNIDRLNITVERKFQFASRATLLPVTLQQLRSNKLNFVSLTPGTSFNLRSRIGWQGERAILYSLLRKHWDVPDGPLRNVLRGKVRWENWRAYLGWFERDVEPKLDEELKQAFYRALDDTSELRARYEEVANQIGGRRKHLTDEMREARNRLIGRLRRLLARSSLSALEPDLVILDEFQRFKYLLDDRHDAGLLAQELFGFQDVKILLLSATPYKMYTLQGEEDEDHYQDFYATVRFLLKGQPGVLCQLQSAVGLYREAMFHLAGYGHGELQRAKAIIEGILRRVMVRTERLAVSADRNGMLAESFAARDQIRPADLVGFVHLDKIARAIDAGDQVEYWKSAAYPLNLMDRYKLKDRFTATLEGSKGGELSALLREAQGYLLSWKEIQAYQAIDPGNARLRALGQDSVETGNWRLLWMPPSLPYYQPHGLYRDIQPDGCTKTLIFSAWKLVPKTIAVLLSYEAERRMLGEKGQDFSYTELTDKRRSLLRFTLSRKRLTGMPVFCLTYPCLTLAWELDPLAVARRLMNGTIPSWEAVFDATRTQIDELLKQATASVRVKRGRRVDERWYWAALALLDHHFHQETLNSWLSTPEERLAWARMLDTDPTAGDDKGGEGENRFADHVKEFTRFLQVPEPLGSMPSDLLDVLAYVALSGPGVTALRALLRVSRPEADDQWSAFLASASRVGLAFRTLLNQPEAISLLQSWYPEGAYWQKALRYCSAGNLQAVMDEYLHILYESLGLVGHDPTESVEKLGDTIQRALSLRAPTLRFDEIVLQKRDKPPGVTPRGIRCRYALRFGDGRTADDERTRGVDVRIAFNSPFRPFVLTTTSIGQEGLDFHQYCHRVVHWNLPSNPVDLEQREGRVHRYKGHVIRRNLALKYTLAAVEVDRILVDPWQQIFKQAVKDRSKDANDLVPFWIFEADEGEFKEGAFKIERKVPLLPLSREVGRMEQLKRSLVAYRSVIGQPRQQELLEFLSAHFDEDEIRDLVGSATIDLSPPRQ
jgi:hypothetical protein